MRVLRRYAWSVASWWTIWRAGLFDAGWYAQQQERRVPTAPLALAHYVLRGRAAGLSPHPLFEPSWYAPRDWRTRLADPLASWLRRGADATAGPHPLFDPATWIAAHPEAASWPSGPLGHFVRHATDGTPMPVAAGLLAPFPGADLTGADVTGAPARRQPAPGWGSVRADLTAQQSRWRRDEALRRAPRLARRHDRRADRALTRRHADTVLPHDPQRPLVSIVLPVRDRRRQVVDAITSVQAQTLGDWELLVVDDGSTDGTRDVLDDLARADGRIRVLSSDPIGGGVAGGVSAARNRGIEAAAGRFVAFLDSDNTWTPTFLRTVLAVLIEQGAPVGYAAAEVVEGRRRRWRNLDGGSQRQHVLDLLGVSNHLDLNVLVVERDLLVQVGGFDTTLRRTVDYDLVWRLAERAVPRYVPTVGVRYDAAREAADRITVRERATWREVVKNRRTIDWVALEDGLSRRPAERVSVLVAATRGWPSAWVTATSALRSIGPVDDVTVTVLDDAGRRADSALLRALTLIDPRIQVERTARSVGRPLATNLALAASSGAVVVAVQAGVELWPGWLPALTHALTDPLADLPTRPPTDLLADEAVAAVQPVVLRPDGTVASAGLAGGTDHRLDPPIHPPIHPPVALLAGAPYEDAGRAGPVVPVAAVDDLVMAVRAEDAVAARGLDPLFHGRYALADLGLRLTTGSARHPQRRRVMAVSALDPLAVVAERLRPGAPLAVRDGRPDDGLPQAAVDADLSLLLERWGRRLAEPAAPAATPAGSPAAAGRPIGYPSAGQPALRWAIKTALPVRPDRAHWGDLHFARALAAALERRGQQVVIDHRPAMTRAALTREDVVLVIRGLQSWPGAVPREVSPAVPREQSGAATRMMWVISHPELVTDAEISGYDQVFAASRSWAAAASQRLANGRPGGGTPPKADAVLPLLQATDPRRFHPGTAAPDSGEKVVFVGNSRGRYRPAVRALVEAGIDLAVYGSMWEPFLPPGVVRAAFVPNEQVAGLYAGAGLVLNDHWDDMRAAGFVSNRLFDAAACGARVVSDSIEGVEGGPGAYDLFGGLVRGYRTPQELVQIVREAPHGYPDDDRRRVLAAQIGREHSFDARAATLLDAALRRR